MAALESFSFPENLRDLPLLLRFELKNHTRSAVFLYGVINVMQVCFDISVIGLVRTSYLCVLGNLAVTESVFAHIKCVCDIIYMIICLSQSPFTTYRYL